MKKVIDMIMDGHHDPTQLIFERLHELGWRSPDEVADMRRQLHSAGRGVFITRPAPKGTSIAPCPHCGNMCAVVIDPASDVDEKSFFVECPACLVKTSSYQDPREAISVWNRRIYGKASAEEVSKASG